MSDSGLIIQLKEGSEAAFRELVKAYEDRVYNTVLSIVHNRTDAEDIAQETFIRIFRSVHSFTGNAALSTWIYRIAVNRSLDFLRSKKRQKRFAFITTFFGNDDCEPLHNATDFFHPGVALDQKENAAILFKAIKKLPEKQQAAFILNKIEGLSYNEIAAVLMITEAAADALLQRAKQNLRKFIDKRNI